MLYNGRIDRGSEGQRVDALTQQCPGYRNERRRPANYRTVREYLRKAGIHARIFQSAPTAKVCYNSVSGVGFVLMAKGRPEAIV
jgi:hypothetical protein